METFSKENEWYYQTLGKMDVLKIKLIIDISIRFFYIYLKLNK